MLTWSVPGARQTEASPNPRLFSISRTRLTAGLLLVGGIFALSPLLNVISPIRGSIISLVAALGIVLVRMDWLAMNKRTIALILLTLPTSAISATYWAEPGMMFIPIYVISSALAISVLTRADVDAFITVFTWLAMGMLIGAIIGVAYALVGGTPLFTFTNPDGRLNEVFLTTLTNEHYERYIRPAGIFDEPGALSFVVCCLAAIRHTLGRNKRVTWAMLLLGLVTTSLAHMVYIVLHAANELAGTKHLMKALMVSAIVVVALFAAVNFIPPVQDLYATYVLAKFAISNGRLAGDNRTDLLLNAATLLNLKSFWFGIDSRCAVGIINCTEQGYGRYGENPLTLLVQWGALVAFPYYLGLIYLGVVAVLRRSLLPLAILGLLLQRPYTMSFGYALLIILTIAVLANKIPAAQPRMASVFWGRHLNAPSPS